MIEILVKAPDVDRDTILKNRYGKGFPVDARLHPCTWGGAEQPPEYVRIRITDTDDVTDWNTPWTRIVSYQILAHDASTDFFRVKIFPTDKKTASALTVEEMRQFLTDWGAEELESDNPDLGVIFEITAMDAINHRGLFTFGDEDDFVKYTEIGYDMATGAHEISMDYSLSSITEDVVRSVLTEAGMDIIGLDQEVGMCAFIGWRHKMIGLLEQQVAQKFNKMLTRVRWRFSDNTVMDALMAGGVKEMTLAEAEADMIDIAEEV